MKRFFTIFFLITAVLALVSCSLFPSKPASTAVPTQVIPKSTPTQQQEPLIGPQIPLIFSHDGAPDDIITAVYLAKHPQIDMLGVILSYGEIRPPQAAPEWSAFLYEVLDEKDVPLAVGSSQALDPASHEFPLDWRNSADEFWGLELPQTTLSPVETSGADLLIELVNASPQKVTVLVTGANTDLALALQKDPAIAENITRVVIMGGAFHTGGNIYANAGDQSNDVAEWNIFVDPLAAKIVFNAGISLLVMPLDAANGIWVTPDATAQLEDVTDPAMRLLSQLFLDQFERWGGPFQIWDVLAAVAMVDESIFTWEYDVLDVIDIPGDAHGQTIDLDQESATDRFAVTVDPDQLGENLLWVFSQ